MAFTGQIADTSTQVLRIPIPVIVSDNAGNSFTLTSSGAIPVQSQAAASATATLQNAATATGNGTVLNVLGMSTVAVTITGITTATITFEVSEDGTNWASVNAIQSGTNTVATTATSNGDYVASCAGFQSFRARISAYTSGTITATAHAVPGQNEPRVVNANIVAGTAAIGSVKLLDTGGSNVGAISAAGALLTAPSLFYPAAATALTADSGNQANASAAATLAGVSAKTTYITGFACTASGATAASVVTVTVAGVITGTLHYTFVAPAGVTAQATPLVVQFPYPIPASAVNTAIVVTLPALGSGNTNATTAAYGFQM